MSESFGWLLLDFLEYYGVEPPVPGRPTLELPPVSPTSPDQPPPDHKNDDSPDSDSKVEEKGETAKSKPDSEPSVVEDVEEETVDPSKGFYCRRRRKAG